MELFPGQLVRAPAGCTVPFDAILLGLLELAFLPYYRFRAGEPEKIPLISSGDRQSRLCMSSSEYIFGVPHQLDSCFVAALTIDLAVLAFPVVIALSIPFCTTRVHHLSSHAV
jgi:hypothetical protein